MFSELFAPVSIGVRTIAKTVRILERNHICVTGDEERPTPEQKRELISGVTKLVGDVLGKNTSNMVVIIDEIPMENYGIGGKTVRERRKEQQK